MRPRIFRRAERGGRSPTRGRGRDCHGGEAAPSAARRRSRGHGGPCSRPRLRGRLPLDRPDSGCGRTTENRKVVRVGAVTAIGRHRAPGLAQSPARAPRPAGLSHVLMREGSSPARAKTPRAAPGGAKSLVAGQATRRKKAFAQHGPKVKSEPSATDAAPRLEGRKADGPAFRCSGAIHAASASPLAERAGSSHSPLQTRRPAMRNGADRGDRRRWVRQLPPRRCGKSPDGSAASHGLEK